MYIEKATSLIYLEMKAWILITHQFLPTSGDSHIRPVY